MKKAMSSNLAAFSYAAFFFLLSIVSFDLSNSSVDEWIGEAAIAFGWFLATCGTICCLGGALHLIMYKRSPVSGLPPGNLVAINGRKMHILAEGKKRHASEPTIVWIPGSHDAGVVMQQLHDKMKSTHRSIIYDRAGSGFSEVGPFPRDVNREARELSQLLKKSDEKGPFVLAAHSLGGLVATKFAKEFPNHVSGIALLDAVCPRMFEYPLNYSGPKANGDRTIIPIMASLGLLWFIIPRSESHNASHAWRSRLIRDFQALPKTHVGFISALRSAYKNPAQLVQGQGTLDDLPLLVIIPEADEATEVKVLSTRLKRLNREEIVAFVAERVAAQKEAATLSSNSILVYAPSGTDHRFPFQDPDFVVEQVRTLANSGTRAELAAAGT